MRFNVLLAVVRTLTSPNHSALEKIVFSWILLRSGLAVLSGPFQGLHYVSQSTGSAFYPKLLGTYELELTGIIADVIARKPDLIIDAGAAEGYFAVGLAFRCPNASIKTFDPDFRACHFQQILSQINRVRDRIEIHCKPCSVSDLEEALAEATSSFLLMDVEGAECELLDATRVPALRGAEILVELHEKEGEDFTTEFSRRFSGTHDCRVINSSMRRLQDSPIRLGMFGPHGLSALNEGRDVGQRWLHLRPI